MAETKTYTPQGFKALQDELDYLVNVKVEENKKFTFKKGKRDNGEERQMEE